jgi:hypothetical protein
MPITCEELRVLCTEAGESETGELRPYTGNDMRALDICPSFMTENPLGAMSALGYVANELGLLDFQHDAREAKLVETPSTYIVYFPTITWESETGDEAKLGTDGEAA